MYFLPFSHCGGFLSGCGDGDFLRRGKCLFRVLSLGVAVLVEGQLSNERSRGFGSFRVPLCRRTRRVVSPARSVLSELLLFRELQTIVSAVAFAKGTRGKPVGSNALPKLACWL